MSNTIENLFMRDLISQKHRHLLYKDESSDLCDFLILKYAEVYRVSESELRVIVWSPSKFSKLKKMGVISDEWGTDDGLLFGTVKNSKLDVLIELGATKKRIYKNGKNLIKLEQLLAHKIYPFNPYLGD